MFEIQAGKLAQDKAANAAHKDFGKMLVDDHTKTSEQMKMMAPKMGAQLPTELDAKHKGVMQKLQSADGPRFDDQFKAAQVDGHKDAVKLFETYAQKGDNAELKQLAQQTLPKLKEHLQHAQQLPKGGQAPTVGSGAPRAR
jgi:putative membrane protein